MERRYSTSTETRDLTASDVRKALGDLPWPEAPSNSRPRHAKPTARRPPLLQATPTYLDNLLLGIRQEDASLTARSFLEWTGVLANEDHKDHMFVLKQLRELPAPVLSEIIRNMDPIEHPELDLAHGLRLTQGTLQYTDLHKLTNDHGVRSHHELVLEGMATIMYLCLGARVLLNEDFVVFLRCAGAAQDYLFATKIYGAMVKAGIRQERNARTWKEFLRARFLLHPTYYQYDRARGAYNPRDLVSHQDKLDGRHDMIQKMDQIRFSEALFSRFVWNRQLRPGGYFVDSRQLLSRKAQSTTDMYFYFSRKRKEAHLKAYKQNFGRMFRGKVRKMARRRAKWTKGPNLWSRRVKRLRRVKFGIWGRGSRVPEFKPDARKLYRRRRARNKIIERFFRRINGSPRDPKQSFWRGYVKSITRPNVVDEELICLFIRGFARANDTRAILSLILRPYYWVEVSAKYGKVMGGKAFHKDSIQKPTFRLLEAIVDAFGSMSQISLALQLVDHFARTYALRIPFNVWSNLLSWSFTAASKTNQKLRRIYEDADNTRIDIDHVNKIWEIMTSPPYNYNPSFESLDIYIKALIINHQFQRAAEVIRTSAIPYLEGLHEEHTATLFDEVLLKDATLDPAQRDSTTVSLAVRRRQAAETKKDYVRNRICTWFDDMLREASHDQKSRDDATMTQFIPALLHEFAPFFQSGIRYRISTGYVNIVDPQHSNINFTHTETYIRHTIPSGLASAMVKESAVDEKGVRWKKHNRDGVAYRDKRGRLVKDKKFAWPTTQSLPVLEKRRVPRKRWGVDVRAPWKGTDEAREKNWWERLRVQLMM